MTQIMVKLDTNNVVIGYGVCLNKQHEPIPGGVKISTDLDLSVVELKDNYKLIDGALIELNEDEKPFVVPQTSELDILKEQVESQNRAIAELTLLLFGGM